MGRAKGLNTGHLSRDSNSVYESSIFVVNRRKIASIRTHERDYFTYHQGQHQRLFEFNGSSETSSSVISTSKADAEV